MMHRVFAYGSNMDVKDLARWASVKGYEQPHVQRAQLARLNDFELEPEGETWTVGKSTEI